jgi:hypothetical protein
MVGKLLLSHWALGIQPCQRSEENELDVCKAKGLECCPLGRLPAVGRSPK